MAGENRDEQGHQCRRMYLVKHIQAGHHSLRGFTSQGRLQVLGRQQASTGSEGSGETGAAGILGQQGQQGHWAVGLLGYWAAGQPAAGTLGKWGTGVVG